MEDIETTDPRMCPAIPRDRERHESLRLAIEVETEGSLWGVTVAFVPRLADVVFGDGEALFWFTTVRDRPAYWVVRGDSSWSETNRCSPPEREFDDIDGVELIKDALVEQFGDGRSDADAEGGGGEPFPAIDDEMGCTWGRMDWPDMRGWAAPAQGAASGGEHFTAGDASS